MKYKFGGTDKKSPFRCKISHHIDGNVGAKKGTYTVEYDLFGFLSALPNNRYSDSVRLESGRLSFLSKIPVWSSSF